MISRCQGLFPSTSFSVEKSFGNEVAVLRISRMHVSVYFCPPYLSWRRLKLSLTSHNNMISGKENSRLKVINSHLKQKYMFPESCSSEKATNQRKSERCVGFLSRKQRHVQDCNKLNQLHADFNKSYKVSLHTDPTSISRVVSRPFSLWPAYWICYYHAN